MGAVNYTDDRCRMGEDPVVIDRRGHVWAYADWDFELHEPRRGARPRR